MTLIRRGAVVGRDDYTLLADDAAVPAAAGAYLVSWERWSKEGAAFGAAQSVGLKLPNTLDVLQHAQQLLPRPLLVLEFPSFPDGRAYSQARLLRDRLGYAGELRAAGAAVVRDQILGMLRCGFDSFELRPDQDASQCLAALREFSQQYQPAADHATPVLRKRRISA